MPPWNGERRLIEWLQKLPVDVAKKQVQWERDRAIRRAFECGISGTQIAAAFSLNRQYCYMLRERLRADTSSPCELYLRDATAVVGSLATDRSAIRYFVLLRPRDPSYRGGLPEVDLISKAAALEAQARELRWQAAKLRGKEIAKERQPKPKTKPKPELPIPPIQVIAPQPQIRTLRDMAAHEAAAHIKLLHPSEAEKLIDQYVGHIRSEAADQLARRQKSGIDKDIDVDTFIRKHWGLEPVGSETESGVA